MIFFKLIIVALYFLGIRLYSRNRKHSYMQKKKKWMDIFYVFYSAGIFCFIFDLHLIAMIIYFFAMFPLLKARYEGEFYECYKEWEKTTKVSKFEKTLVLLSLKKSQDFEEYRFVKEMEHLKEKLGIKE